MYQVVIAILTIWLLRFAVTKSLAVKRLSERYGYCPGDTFLLLHPFRAITLVAAPFFPPKGFMGYYFANFTTYTKYGSSCLRSYLPWGDIPIFFVSDADTIKVIASERSTFPKELEAYRILEVYGENLVSVESGTWKRHRSVVNPAFSEANNAFAWTESLRVVQEWFSQLDTTERKTGKDPIINTVTDFTKATLLIIAAAGFGRHVSWSEDGDCAPPLGHRMAFRPAVVSAVESLFPKSIVPRGLYQFSLKFHVPWLSPYLHHSEDSIESLRAHMTEVISGARTWIAGGKVGNIDAALLRNMVDANVHDEDTERKSLTDDELLSNTFAFLLAGHETTAHALSFTLAFLALYPSVQDNILKEVTMLWSGPTPLSDHKSFKDSFPKLQYTLATFHESLRLFPPVVRLVKKVARDTTVMAKNFSMSSDGKVQDVRESPVNMMVESLVIIDIKALHQNPIHWGNDAKEFKPERFIDTDTYRWPRDAFLAFASGARGCVGQRFALAEAVCVLAHIAQRYEVLLPEELLILDREKQEQKLFEYFATLTIVPRWEKFRFRRRIGSDPN